MSFTGEHYQPEQDLHRLLRTTVTIFDSAISLLDGPGSGEIEMPGPGYRACVKRLLDSLCSEEAALDVTEDLIV
jgi:hypothetical protein